MEARDLVLNELFRPDSKIPTELRNFDSKKDRPLRLSEIELMEVNKDAVGSIENLDSNS
jgi:hypothetical protein